MIAFVLAVIARSIWSGSRFKVSGRQSTSFGLACKCNTTAAVAAKVSVGTRTSSPALIPTASSARCRAEVAELTATACRQPRYRAKSSSNCLTLGPVVSQPERRVSTTAWISSSPISGMWNGRNEVCKGGSFLNYAEIVCAEEGNACQDVTR